MSKENRWFWGQFGIGKGKYAYCTKCNTKVPAIIKKDGKSYCKRCDSEVEWKEKT